MDKEQLAKILADHKAWLNGESGGFRADLRHADLSRADLRHANLNDAYLSRADLSRANLSAAIGKRLTYKDLIA